MGYRATLAATPATLLVQVRAGGVCGGYATPLARCTESSPAFKIELLPPQAYRLTNTEAMPVHKQQ